MTNFSNNSRLSLRQMIIFELLSWFGRNFKNKKSKISTTKDIALLDLGAGSNYAEGWINADFYPFPRLKFWKKYQKRIKHDAELDLRFPLNCLDNYIDGVYSGHTLEHLQPNAAINLLKEIYRVLKPGCWLRINVPDLGKFVDFYCGKVVAKEFFENYKSGCEAISNLAQDDGHISLWDEYLLSYTLESVGFVNVKKVEFGTEGTDKRLIKEEDVRKWSTLVMEAQKPLCNK